MSTKLTKCNHCGQEIYLEQRSVRFKNEWFHIECFKSTLEPKKKSQELPKTLVYHLKEKSLSNNKQLPKIQTYHVKEKPTQISDTKKPIKAKIISGSVYAAKIQKSDKKTPPNTKSESTVITPSDSIKQPSIASKPTIDTTNHVSDSKAKTTITVEPDFLKPRTKKHLPVFPVLVSIVLVALAWFVYSNHDLLYQRFVLGFLKWVQTLGFWDFVVILSFTVAIDISRNIGKCGILISHAVKQKIKPPQLNLADLKISILVPAHNESAAIRNTIMSLLENSYQNKEIIVIDDHSTDNTYDQALPFYKSGKIKLLRRKDSIGSKTLAINYGLLFATGDVIIVTDGDTIVERNAISEVAKQIALPGNIAVSGNVRILAGDGGVKNLLTRCQSYEYLIAFELGRRYNALLNMLIIIPGAFSVFLKDAIKGVGQYDRDTMTEDFDLTLKLLKTGGKIDFASKGVAWTYCPNNWKAWARQRIRWAHGEISTLLKHKDIESASYFRHRFVLAVYDMVFMNVVLLLVRMAGMVWLAFHYADSVIYVYVLIYALYYVNEAIVISTSALLSPHKKDLKYVYLIPFIVTIYRPIYTYVRFYGYLKSLLKKESKW